MRALRTFPILLVAVALLLVAGMSSAGTITHNASIPLSSTNWTGSMVFPQFDPANGCLDSVCVSLAGHVQGAAKFESLDGTPTTVSMNMQSTITLKRPDMSTLVVTIPLANTADGVTAFDGVIDFGGTSGKTYAALSADKTETRCVSSALDLSLFTGTGNISLPCDAAGTSNGSGAGNLILQFTTAASSGAEVTYHYSDCPTPAEKATWGRIKSLYR